MAKGQGRPVFRSVSDGVPPEPTPLFISEEPEVAATAGETPHIIDVTDEDTVTNPEPEDDGNSKPARKLLPRGDWDWSTLKSQTSGVINTSISDARSAATDLTPSKRDTVPASESALTIKIVAIGVIIVFILALTSWFWPRSHNSPTQETLDLAPVPDLKVLPDAPPAPLTIAGVSTVSGLADGYDHPELAGLAIDHQPETSWNTSTLRSPKLSYGRGYGLVLNLGEEPVTVKKVVLTTPTTGGNLELRNGNAENFRDATVLGSQPLSANVTFALASPVETNSLVLWCTEMPTAPGGGYRLSISEVQVLG